MILNCDKCRYFEELGLLGKIAPFFPYFQILDDSNKTAFNYLVKVAEGKVSYEDAINALEKIDSSKKWRNPSSFLFADVSKRISCNKYNDQSTNQTFSKGVVGEIKKLRKVFAEYEGREEVDFLFKNFDWFSAMRRKTQYLQDCFLSLHDKEDAECRGVYLLRYSNYELYRAWGVDLSMKRHIQSVRAGNYRYLDIEIDLDEPLEMLVENFENFVKKIQIERNAFFYKKDGRLNTPSFAKWGQYLKAYLLKVKKIPANLLNPEWPGKTLNRAEIAERLYPDDTDKLQKLDRDIREANKLIKEAVKEQSIFRIGHEYRMSEACPS